MYTPTHTDNTMNTETMMNATANVNEEMITCALPMKLQKMMEKIGSLKERLHENKREAMQMCVEVNSLEKMMEQYILKTAKESLKTTTEKRKRKPSGFASPTKVSPELCHFMGRPEGDLISRTETSKFLSNYITRNRLTDPKNKTIIRPDNVLAHLLGDEALHNEITYFTIQKYMNRHFTTANAEQVAECSV